MSITDYDAPRRSAVDVDEDSLEQSTVILPLVRPRQQDDTVVLYFPAGIFDED